MMGLSTINHRLTDSGVAIVVREGNVVKLHGITDSAAKRLAWGILADLEPDEQPIAGQRPRARGDAPIRSALLTALSFGDATRHDVSRSAGMRITTNAICQAIDLGLVARVSPKRYGNVPAVYQITEAGREAIAQRVRA